MSPTTENVTPEMNRPSGRDIAGAGARIVGVVALVAVFSIPPFLSAFWHADIMNAPVALALLPIGVYLVKRLTPKADAPAATAILLVPLGSLWLVSGAMAFLATRRLSRPGEFEPSLGTIAAGVVLLIVGSGAAWLSQTASDRRTVPSGSKALFATHLLGRILGVFFIAAAVALPILSNSYRQFESAAAPISLALLPAGAFVATRSFPRRAIAALATTLLLPAGSVLFMFGILAGARTGDIQPDIGTVAAGLALLAMAAAAARSAWGSAARMAKVAARTMAVVVWGVTATISIQAVAEQPLLNYIEVLDLHLAGSDLIVKVPFQGGCAGSHLTVTTTLRGDALEVLVTEPFDTFHCAAGCAAGGRLLCTESVFHRVNPPPPPGVSPVAATRPAKGLLRLPFVSLMGGLALGSALWAAGKRLGEPGSMGDDSPTSS